MLEAEWLLDGPCPTPQLGRLWADFRRRCTDAGVDLSDPLLSEARVLDIAKELGYDAISRGRLEAEWSRRMNTVPKGLAGLTGNPIAAGSDQWNAVSRMLEEYLPFDPQCSFRLTTIDEVVNADLEAAFEKARSDVQNPTSALLWYRPPVPEAAAAIAAVGFEVKPVCFSATPATIGEMGLGFHTLVLSEVVLENQQQHFVDNMYCVGNPALCLPRYVVALQVTPAEPPRCVKHPPQLLNHWCWGCRCLVCEECGEEHREAGHTVCSAGEAVTTMLANGACKNLATASLAKATELDGYAVTLEQALADNEHCFALQQSALRAANEALLAAAEREKAESKAALERESARLHDDLHSLRSLVADYRRRLQEAISTLFSDTSFEGVASAIESIELLVAQETLPTPSLHLPEVRPSSAPTPRLFKLTPTLPNLTPPPRGVGSTPAAPSQLCDEDHKLLTYAIGAMLTFRGANKAKAVVSPPRPRVSSPTWGPGDRVKLEDGYGIIEGQYDGNDDDFRDCWWIRHENGRARLRTTAEIMSLFTQA
eukprot:Sspe_Gene.5277::Locus_1738_Transcript_1_1_Confidence_1.000_Length_3497::g.5277::m.5277